jgi:hypothetical protein
MDATNKYCRWERKREELGATRCGCGGLIVRNQGAWVCEDCGAHYDRQLPTKDKSPNRKHYLTMLWVALICFVLGLAIITWTIWSDDDDYQTAGSSP